MTRPVARARGGARSARARGGARPARLAPRLVAAAAETACLLELEAEKPGNVGRGRDRPDLTYRDFVLSAEALGTAFRRHARSRVGRLVLETIRATRRYVSTNTNLGMALLMAPLARAALRPGSGSLRRRLLEVLADLDLNDARHVYAAIRLARPGGLGRVPRQDVRRSPTETLLACMRLAADRDVVAREYATGFETTFRIALPALRRQRARGLAVPDAILCVYLTLLAGAPDTLVARRHGERAARAVSRAAAGILAAGGPVTRRGRLAMARLDRRLRRARPPINPGATADVVAAGLFVWLLEGASFRPSRRRQ